MAYDFDLVVIGGGPAGEKGAVQAAYFGKKVALVERAPSPGGACVHTGTLPSKTLRETSIALSGYRQAELYGLTIELNRDLAVPKLLSRKDAVRGLEVSRILWNLDRHNVQLLKGRAELIDNHTIRIVGSGTSGPRTVTADRF
ncbi:MAG: FAD-dependent oxidoreductase [Polyangiaceae bacterium]